MPSQEDILNQVANGENANQQTPSNSDFEKLVLQHLSNIYQTVSRNGMSQSNARDFVTDARTRSGQSKGYFGREYEARSGSGFYDSKSFLDQFEKSLLDEFLGDDFKKELKSIGQDFADQLGLDLDNLSGSIGKKLGKQAANIFKQTDLGKKVTGYTDQVKQNITNKASDLGQKAVDKFKDPNFTQNAAQKVNDYFGKYKQMSGSGVKSWLNIPKMSGNMVKDVFGTAGKAAGSAKNLLTSIFSTGAGSAASTAAGTAASGAAAAGTAAAGLGTALAAACPYVLAAVVAFKAIKTVLSSVTTAFKALKTMIDAAKKAGNREQESREKNLKLAKTRMEQDYEVIIKRPFEILEAAAQSIYDTWNNNLSTITATQGYTKSDVQDLMSAFATRLRSEGLSDYISGSDLTNNLAKVLESGMSGSIAEEFAYQATKLNAAVPTQDFFNYASTYASIAANAVRSGASQSEAIELANQSLSSFASGLLYTSRELTGGFTTGLQNASSLYEQATKIAQAAKSDNISDISGVLLATQGYLGAVAPDLASSITDTIYKALTGGNSSDIVALRSLAGVNASNTEFLQAFAKNPQKIFATLFENLAAMYTDSSDAYMEKAEGYASLFGLTSEAFQRIDFAGLADAISKMNMNNASSSLSENMELLVEGQTTTTAEQLKAQQINKYMIEEGLAYVIDNEAAQLIQQHMWEEQMNRELMEAQYSVELKGSALEALEMLKKSVSNILNFLNPFSWLKKIGNVIATANEAAAQEADVRQLLELGKVGNGNTQDLYNLTTRNANLNLTSSLIDMMGGVSAYGIASRGTQIWNNMTNFQNQLDGLEQLLSWSAAATQNALFSSQGSGLSSRYNWGSISKSGAKAATVLLNSGSNPTTSNLSTSLATVTTSSGTSAASNSATAVKASLDKMLDDSYLVDQFVKQGKSYEDWAATASKFNITDLSKAIEAAGYSETDIQAHFQDKETEQGVEEQQAIRLHEKLFRDTGIKFWTEDFPNEYRDPLFELLETNNARLKDIYDEQVNWLSYYKTEWINKGWPAYVTTGAGSSGLFNKLYNEFMKYFVKHTYYSNTEGYTYSDVEEIQRKSKEKENGDTVYALAEMLTKNMVDLKDPTMQTNALLGQILIVVNAIMNQQNEVAGTTGQSALLESLSAMALGMTTTNTGTTT